MRHSLRAALTLLALCIAGCASPPKASAPGISNTSGTTLVESGYIVDVRDVTLHDNRSAPLSPVIGALLGGVAGSMIGSGTGRAVATAGGAAGGSFAAQQATKSGSIQLIRITVRLDDGRENTYDTLPEDAFRTGDRVQIVTNSGKPKVIRPTISTR